VILKEIKAKSKSDTFTVEYFKKFSLHCSYFCNWIKAIENFYDARDHNELQMKKKNYAAE
jgi:hypothetical protein